MAETAEIGIQVVYASPEHQALVSLTLPAGSTLRQALEASGLPAAHGIDIDTARFGIYGKAASLETVLRAHDRVEIYRPLIADPKAVRKARAAQGKAVKKGGGSAPVADA